MEDAASHGHELDPARLIGAIAVLRIVADEAHSGLPSPTQLGDAADVFLQCAACGAAVELQRDALDAAAILHGLATGTVEPPLGLEGRTRAGQLVATLSVLLQAAPR